MKLLRLVPAVGLMVVATACADSPTVPTEEIAPQFVVPFDPINCPAVQIHHFKPECESSWHDTLTDHTEPLNDAMAAARAYTGGQGIVPLEERTYYFHGTLNPGFDYSPPGIIVRNAQFQTNKSFLVTNDVASGTVTIQGGDLFQFINIEGPYRGTGRPGLPAWTGPTNYPYCTAGASGPVGVNGSVSSDWTIHWSTVEGFADYGVLMSGTKRAKISWSVIQSNGHAGVQIVKSPSTGFTGSDNTIEYSQLIYNGANGIDINGDDNTVVFSNASHNGLYNSCYDDRAGILVWASSDQGGISASRNTIQSNDAHLNVGPGIYVGTSVGGAGSLVGNKVLFNNVTYNLRHGIRIDAWVGDNVSTEVSGNTIAYNGKPNDYNFAELSYRLGTSGSFISGLANLNTMSIYSGACVEWPASGVTRAGNTCNGAPSN